MFESVLVYGFILVCFFFLGKTASKNFASNSATPFYHWEIIVILLLFSILCGLRNMVGVDWFQYKETYNNPNYLMYNEKEWLFYGFTSFLAEHNIHYTFYFGIIAFFQMFFILKTFENERSLYPYLLIALMTNGTFFMWMNGVRQCLAMCIFIYATRYIKERKLLWYLFFIFLCFSIHRSSIILVPLFLPVFSKDIFKSKFLQFGLLIIAVVLSNVPFWNAFLEQIGIIGDLLDFGSNGVSTLDRLEYYDFSIMSHGARFYATLVIGIISIILSDQIKTKYDCCFFYNISFIGLLAYFLFYSFPIFSRPFIFFTYSQFIIQAYILLYLKNALLKKDLFLKASLYIMLAAFFYATLASNFYTQYHFFWEENILIDSGVQIHR